MNDQPKRDFAPYICLGTDLVLAGTELIEMAGAVHERSEASEFHLKRAEKAARKALAAVDEYYRHKDAAALKADPVIDWPRPSCDRKDTGLRFGDGMRAEDMLEGHGDD